MFNLGFIAAAYLIVPYMKQPIDGMAIGAVKGFVPVEQGLHLVGGGRDVVRTFDRITRHRGVESNRGAGCEALDVDPEDLDRLHPRSNLESGLGLVPGGVERCLADQLENLDVGAHRE